MMGEPGPIRFRAPFRALRCAENVLLSCVGVRKLAPKLRGGMNIELDEGVRWKTPPRFPAHAACRKSGLRRPRLERPVSEEFPRRHPFLSQFLTRCGSLPRICHNAKSWGCYNLPSARNTTGQLSHFCTGIQEAQFVQLVLALVDQHGSRRSYFYLTAQTRAELCYTAGR